MPQVLASEDRDEFDRFYRADCYPLVGFVLKLGATPDEAWDAAQTAMFEVASRWKTTLLPRAYVRTVATRVFIDARETGRKANRTALRHAAMMPMVTPAADVDGEAKYVLGLLARLPLQQRIVMALTYEELSPAEIAEVSGQEPATVRSNLRHARAAMIKMLEDANTEEVTATHGP